MYTGKETKIQMNMTEPPIKVSNIERRLNGYILGLFASLFTLCCIGAVSNSVNMEAPTFVKAWYLSPENPAKTFLPGDPGMAGASGPPSSALLSRMSRRSRTRCRHAPRA